MRDVHGGRHGRLLPRDDLEHVDGDAEHDRVGEAHGDGHPVEVVPPDVGADGELVRGALQYTAGNDGSHLSPAFFKISDLAPDRGILQSELFTSRSQNLVLAKLPNSGFGRYGQFFK